MPLGAHKDRSTELLAGLSRFESENNPLLGIVDAACRETLIAQMISSLRRVEYINVLVSASLDADRCVPTSRLFDPIRGAALLSRKGEFDEAVWMTFVATHFGKHSRDGWKLAANVMGSFGKGPVWTAAQYSRDQQDFENMLEASQSRLSDPNQSGRFSNHRQYQSKDAATIARVFRTFYEWQFKEGGFAAKVRSIHRAVGQEPTQTFDQLYKSMKTVFGFGRLGNFDFLTMIGKLQLAPIVPGSVYLQGATGPLAGAKLLFHGNREFQVGAQTLGRKVDALDEYLNVGKQVLEDSMCNWQKSPATYVYFKG
ncbi:MAG: hypothetical protein WBA62_02485 [Xanthobacteraceae bacterium]